MSVTGAAMVAGIVGYPVAHSMSPLLHGYWIEEYGLNAAYVPFAIAPEHFSEAIDGLRLAGVRGVNVTVPHKQRAFAIATDRHASAAIAGASNLMVFAGEKISAFNTDSLGTVAALNATLGEGSLKGRTAVIWGAGGMARAAVCALASMGVAEIVILARTPAKAETLVSDLKAKVAVRLGLADFSAWPQAGAQAALLVNATAAGMSGRPPLALSLDVLPKTAAVFDAVYTPLQTPLLAQARAAGLTAIDGLGLLMHQAVPSFEAFFGRKPVITDALRAHLVKALGLG
jgi:shikimate dehydrogenase